MQFIAKSSYTPKKLFVTQAQDLLEKLAEILLYNFHREHFLLKLKIKKLLRKIRSKNLSAGVFFFLSSIHEVNSTKIPATPSLSDETLRRGLVFWDALKAEPLPFEPSSAPGHSKHTQNNKPTRPVLVKAKEHGPNTIYFDPFVVW